MKLKIEITQQNKNNVNGLKLDKIKIHIIKIKIKWIIIKMK